MINPWEKQSRAEAQGSQSKMKPASNHYHRIGEWLIIHMPLDFLASPRLSAGISLFRLTYPNKEEN